MMFRLQELLSTFKVFRTEQNHSFKANAASKPDILRFGRRIKFIGFSESMGDVAADDAAELGSAATESFY